MRGANTITAHLVGRKKLGQRVEKRSRKLALRDNQQDVAHFNLSNAARNKEEASGPNRWSKMYS